jgi:Xaa-Pro aminopeptidase
VPRDEIDRRIAHLREGLRGRPVGAVLALQRAEVIYFAGTPQDGIVWIPREGDPVFLVRRDLERARRESPLPGIIPFARPSEIPALLGEHGLRLEGPVGTSLDVLPVKLWQSLSRALGVPIEDVSREMRGTRIVKSEWERARVREAGALADGVFALARARLREGMREGMREIDLAAEIDAFLIRSGSVAYYRTRGFNLEFPTLCCLAGDSGDWRGAADSPNGAGRGPDPSFGQGSSGRAIGRGEPILVDLGTNRGGYYADTTRVFHLGELPRRFSDAQRVSEEILARAVEDIEGGRPLEEVYVRSVETARGAGLEAEFMGGSRFLGHGVGLEIDEWPVVAEGFEEPLPEGAALSLEPKFALPGGIVGVETTYILEGGRLHPVVTLPPGATRVG